MLNVVNLTDVSSSSIILQWQNPSSSGVPAFIGFLVELVSKTPPFINISRTVTATSTDPSYINTFTVTGLKPNTNYTASVRAVSSLLDMSCMEQGVDLPGPISNEVSFMTMLGGECKYVTLCCCFKLILSILQIQNLLAQVFKTLQESLM